MLPLILRLHWAASPDLVRRALASLFTERRASARGIPIDFRRFPSCRAYYEYALQELRSIDRDGRPTTLVYRPV